MTNTNGAVLELSMAIYKLIYVNLHWVYAYKFIDIILAVAVFLPWDYHLHPMVILASSIGTAMSNLTLKRVLKKYTMVLTTEKESRIIDHASHLSLLVYEE
jgi:cation transport ATPase